MSDERTIDRFSEEAILHWVTGIAQQYRWTGWQGLDRVKAATEGRVLIGSYELGLRSTEVRPFVAGVSGQPAAATIVTPEPMTSEHFDLATASVAHVVCDAGTRDRHDVIRQLLERVVDDARQQGTDLLVLRVAADDVETLSAAQRAGFDVQDATITFLADAASAGGPVEPPPGLTVEVHEGDVSGALSADDVRAVAAATNTFDLGHYRADPALPNDAVDRFHDAVVNSIASGAWGDCLTVVRHEGEIVGLESETTDRTLRDLTGLDLRRCNLLIVLANGPRTCRTLVTAAGRHRFPGGSHHTWETQIRDAATIRCIERTGVARPIRAEFVLHSWPRRH